MIFCSNREKIKREKLSEFLFFTLTGGTIGAFIGGCNGIFKRIPLKKVLPQTIFRSAAFFGTVSAVQSTLELGRNEKDSLNCLVAGGWTGFIFGYGITKNLKYGLVLGLNGAMMNWMVQNFARLPNCLDQFKGGLDALNPIFTAQNFKELQEKIETLKGDIDKLKDNEE